jgi:hypothetical protein
MAVGVSEKTSEMTMTIRRDSICLHNNGILIRIMAKKKREISLKCDCVCVCVIGDVKKEKYFVVDMRKKSY